MLLVLYVLFVNYFNYLLAFVFKNRVFQFNDFDRSNIVILAVSI